MNEGMILGMVIVGVLVLDWFRRTYAPILTWQSDDNMPAVLKTAQLYGSEFYVNYAGVQGYIDQAYTTKRGELILLDTKSRGQDRVKESDIWQLSLYRTLLANSQGVEVSRTAFIRVVYYPHGEGSRKVHYRRVKLHNHHSVATRYRLTGVVLAS